MLLTFSAFSFFTSVHKIYLICVCICWPNTNMRYEVFYLLCANSEFDSAEIGTS